MTTSYKLAPDADVIIAQLRAGKTLAAIGTERGVTRERVRQIVTGSADYWDALEEGRRVRSAATLAASPLRCKACGGPIPRGGNLITRVRCAACLAKGMPCKCGCGQTAKRVFASRACLRRYKNSLPSSRAARKRYAQTDKGKANNRKNVMAAYYRKKGLREAEVI